MKDKTKIIVVDDHQLFRDGLKFILSRIKDVEIIAEASNGQEFLKLLETYQPDIVLMDISMPVMDGIEATKRALEKYPGLLILALSMFGDEEYYYKMVHAGVKGFVLKESGSDELSDAIKEITSGNNYFSQELLRKIIINIGNTKQESLVRTKKNTLTNRETEILRYICQGMSNMEIANKLHLSQRTVEGHKANLLKKTSTKNTVNLIMYAIKNNLVEV